MLSCAIIYIIFVTITTNACHPPYSRAALAIVCSTYSPHGTYSPHSTYSAYTAAYVLVGSPMHHGLHKHHACIFGLHELHSCILVCVSMHVFPTPFACFIGMHSGLAYTPVIHSKPNMACVLAATPQRAYVPFISLELVMLTVLHFQINLQ